MNELDIRKWVDRANLDLSAATYLLDGQYYQDAAFHGQQAVEKALKALFLKKFSKLIRTHELVFLAKKVGANPEILKLCETLNPFFVQTRYPGYEEEISAEETEELIANAKKVIEWAVNQL